MTTKIKTFGGNIGIGTTDPGDFKLNVHGSLKTSSLVVNGVTDAQVPIGLLGMWSGSYSSIPSGWALCDGGTYTRTDGGGSIVTPDLRTKFIRGADGDNSSPLVVGTEGGQNTVTLTAAKLASHSHGVSIDSGNANHNHNTAESNMTHDHPVGTTQTPHNHGETSQTNTPHNHGESSNSTGTPHRHSLNQSNMPHSHNTETVDVPHRHNSPALNNRGISGGPGGGVTRANSSLEQFGVLQNGGPHSHTGYQTTPQHSHGCNEADTPHSHNTGSDNWQHSHSLSTKNANHSHNTGEGEARHSHTVNAVDAPHGHGANVNNTGQGTPFSVLNAYYALFYIMKI